MRNIYFKKTYPSIVMWSLSLSASEEMIDVTGKLDHKVLSATELNLENHRAQLEILKHNMRHKRTDAVIDLVNENPLLLNISDQDGKFPVHYACFKGNEKLFQYFILKDPNQKSIRTPKGLTPLSCSILGGRIKIIQLLLDLGTRLDEKIDNGFTTLHIACRYGQIPTAQWFLEKNPRMIDEKTNTGVTAFHIACAHGQIPTVKWLLGKKPGMLDEKTNDGQTGFDWAVRYKQRSVVEFLIENYLGFAVMAQDKVRWEKMMALLHTKTPSSNSSRKQGNVQGKYPTPTPHNITGQKRTTPETSELEVKESRSNVSTP